MSSFMKVRPVGVELFHADRRTVMTKIIVAFSNFANVPKMDIYIYSYIYTHTHTHTHTHYTCVVLRGGADG